MATKRLKSRVLTLKELKAEGACISYRRKFREDFGTSVKLTEARIMRIYDDWNISWAANHLLTGPVHERTQDLIRRTWDRYTASTLSYHAARKRQALLFARGFLTPNES